MLDEAVAHVEQAIALLEKAAEHNPGVVKTREFLWAVHLTNDLKDLKLLAQARREPEVTV